MNKIITINLGGRALQIEENAYQKLSAYFSSLKEHFEDTDNYEEIIEDIEARFADMLFEKLNNTKVSINATDVEHVITVMGDPSTIQQEAEEQAFTEESTTRSNKNLKRRLFRDEDRKLLGGVCAGLANYLNIDVALIRILWLIFFFVGGFGVFLYIILWIVIPKAVTRADKLQMMGEIPNIENIKKAVNKETNRVSDGIKRSNIGPVIEDIAQMIWKVLKVVLKIAAAVMVLGFVISVVAFFVSALMSIGPFEPNQVPFNSFRLFSSSLMVWISKLLILFAFTLPFAAASFALIKYVFEAKISKRVFHVIGGVWVTCLIAILCLAVYGKSLVDEESNVFERQEIVESDSLMISFKNNEDLSKFNKSPNIIIKRSLSDSSYVQIQKSARGKNMKNARSFAEKLVTNISISDGKIIMSKNTGLTKDSPVRYQEVTYVFYLKIGTYLQLDPNTSTHLQYPTERVNQSVWDLAGRAHLMTSKGLKCLDCETTDAVTSSNHSNLLFEELEPFSKVEIEELANVKVVYGNQHRIGFTHTSFKEVIRFKNENNRLKLSFDHNTNWDDFKHLFDDDDETPIVIETPDLTSFKASGALKADIENFKGGTLEVTISGASLVHINDIAYERLFLDLTGASKADLSGQVTELKLSQSGASGVDGYDLKADEVKVDVSGACYTNVFAQHTLTGDISGASSLSYDGAPSRVDVNQSGIGNISSR